MARNPHTLERAVRAKPQTLKAMGGCEALNPKRSECLRNPHTLKSSGRVGVFALKWAKKSQNVQFDGSAFVSLDLGSQCRRLGLEVG